MGHDQGGSIAPLSVRCVWFFLEQTAPLDKFRTLAWHPCARIQCPWPVHWPRMPGHQMYSLGVGWICKRCHCTVRPAATKFSQKLQAMCAGKAGSTVSGFASMLPAECPSVVRVSQPFPQSQKSAKVVRSGCASFWET